MSPKFRALVLTLGLSLFVWVVVACGSRQHDDARGLPTYSDRPRFEVAGCQHRRASRCHLPENRDAILVVWVDVHAGTELDAKSDGGPVGLEPSPADGGVRLTLTIPASARIVTVSDRAQRWAPELVLEIVREPVAAWIAQAEQQPSEMAIARLEAGLKRAEPLERLAGMQRLRRHLVATGDARALRQTELTATLAQTLDRDRDFVDAASASAFLRLAADDLAGARRWGEQLRAVSEANMRTNAAAYAAEINVWAHYQLGLIATREGNYRAATDHLRASRQAADRVGLVEEFVFASEMLSVVYAELGRGIEASAIVEEVIERADKLTDCKQRAELYANAGWASLLLLEAGFYAHEPLELFGAQIALVGPDGDCPDPASMSFARVNSALVAVADREYAEAWDWVEPLTFEPTLDYLRPWVDEVVAQVGLGTGRWDLVPPLVARPPETDEPGLRWRGTVRVAEALTRSGLHEAALAAFTEAEDILEHTMRDVGVRQGREIFLAGRQASSQGLIELLVARGETSAALCRARLARSRAIRALDVRHGRWALDTSQRREREAKRAQFHALQAELAADRQEDWAFSDVERARRERVRATRHAHAETMLDELLREPPKVDASPLQDIDSCTTLPAIAPDHVLLLETPREDGSWLFIADAEGVDVLAAPDYKEGVLPGELHAAHVARIRRAERISIISNGGGWWNHRLKLADEALIDIAPVVYALDLPRSRSDPTAPGSALVATDPSQDLPFARLEASAVADLLRDRGWTVDGRTGIDVTREGIEAALVEVDLLHYAGHGTRGGPDGWDASLILSDGFQLSVVDILSQPRVPAGVVLTGCETTGTTSRTLTGGMNLGHAFVLAGAAWVIGAEGSIGDDVARAIGEALYAELHEAEVFDGPAALRRAQLDLRARDPTSAWDAFRAVTP